MTFRLSTIDLFKENMKFSAGHFTIFSATERERLHGHNFNVGVSITAEVGDNGMCFDYTIYKKIVEGLCHSYNEYFILPTLSPHLQIHENGTQVIATFNGEQIHFLRSDVLLLPIKNATLEEFSDLFIRELTKDESQMRGFGIHAFQVKVFSGPGQSASSSWIRS